VVNAVQELEELARLKYNNPNIRFIENDEIVIRAMATWAQTPTCPPPAPAAACR
jgi:hypothetical protein